MQVIISTLMMGAACGDHTSDFTAPPVTPSRLRASVTGRAASSLGADGLFKLGAPAGAVGEISEPQAIAYATAWTRSFAPMIRDYLEQAHGQHLDFTKLGACGRPLYARSAFAPPGDEMPGPYRRPFGPWWLITLCDQGLGPSLSVAVSAWATDLGLDRGRTFGRSNRPLAGNVV